MSGMFSFCNLSIKSVELLFKGKLMLWLSKKELSCKIILSSSVPKGRDGLDVTQL